MPVFHFDVHHGNSITIDDQGVEVAEMVDVEKLALETLGQSILEDASTQRTGVTKIEVRDSSNRVVLTATATVTLDRPHS